jgi:DNA-binding PadR family transcriptional regulator
MSKKKKTHYALLGLLSWKPMSGYDIKKLVDIGLSHFWNENYGQIYPTLDLLVKNGLAEKSEDKLSGKRKRNIYRITAKGNETFRAWLMMPSDPPSVRNELQLKFFLSGKLPVTTSRRIIREYRAQQTAVLDEYRASEVALREAIESGEYPSEVQEILAEDIKPLSPKQRSKQCGIFMLTLRHGILALEARLAWCGEVEAYLKK